jgi:hypothetical protein
VKLNEFKQQMKNRNLTESQLAELDMSDVIGNYGAAGVKTIADKVNPFSKSSGKISVKDKMASEMFVKDFIGRASEDLARGIKAGLVNPKPATAPEPEKADPYKPDGKTTTTTPAGPDDRIEPTMDPAKATAPAAPTAPGGTAPGPASLAAAGANAQKQTNQNLNAYVQNAAKTLNSATSPQQKMSLTKELVNFMADRKDYPEWNNAVATVQQVIKRGGLDPNFANSAMNRIKAGQTMAEAWQIYAINKLLEAVEITWEQLGLTALNESKNSWKVVDTKYYKLNNIFESIVEADNQYPDTISSYLQKMFKKYTKGVGVDPAVINKVKQIADQAEQNYNSMNPMKRGARQELAQLGNMAYSLSYRDSEGYKHDKFSAADAQSAPQTGSGETSGLDALRGRTSTDAGAAAPATASAEEIAPATTQMINLINKMTTAESGDDLTKIVKLSLQKLYKADKVAYSALMKELRGNTNAPKAEKPATTFTPPARPVPAAAPVSTPAVTAESKLKTYKKWGQP